LNQPMDKPRTISALKSAAYISDRTARARRFQEIIDAFEAHLRGYGETKSHQNRSSGPFMASDALQGVATRPNHNLTANKKTCRHKIAT